MEFNAINPIKKFEVELDFVAIFFSNLEGGLQDPQIMTLHEDMKGLPRPHYCKL